MMVSVNSVKSFQTEGKRKRFEMLFYRQEKQLSFQLMDFDSAHDEDTELFHVASSPLSRKTQLTGDMEFQPKKRVFGPISAATGVFWTISGYWSILSRFKPSWGKS